MRIRFSRSCDAARRAAAPGLFNSCISPAASVPSDAIFSCCSGEALQLLQSQCHVPQNGLTNLGATRHQVPELVLHQAATELGLVRPSARLAALGILASSGSSPKAFPCFDHVQTVTVAPSGMCLMRCEARLRSRIQKKCATSPWRASCSPCSRWISCTPCKTVQLARLSVTTGWGRSRKLGDQFVADHSTTLLWAPGLVGSSGFAFVTFQ